MKRVLRNRSEAGLLLAGKLQEYAGQPGVIVLGLPRGGVPVAFDYPPGLPHPGGDRPRQAQ